MSSTKIAKTIAASKDEDSSGYLFESWEEGEEKKKGGSNSNNDDVPNFLVINYQNWR